MTETQISQLRKQVDRIDEQLLELLIKRLDLAHHIQSHKRAMGRSIHSPGREAEIISVIRRRAERLNSDPDGLEAIYRRILTISRNASEGAVQ